MPELRDFLARFRLTILRLGRQQPCLAGFPARTLTEPVIDVDHPVDIPDQLQRDRDQFPVLRRLRAAGQHHDAVTDGRRQAGRVDRQQVMGQVADVGGDAGVRAQEHAQQVTAADDARRPQATG